jgi:hypothetical protein
LIGVAVGRRFCSDWAVGEDEALGVGVAVTTGTDASCESDEHELSSSAKAIVLSEETPRIIIIILRAACGALPDIAAVAVEMARRTVAVDPTPAPRPMPAP